MQSQRRGVRSDAYVCECGLEITLTPSGNHLPYACLWTNSRTPHETMGQFADPYVESASRANCAYLAVVLEA